MSNSLTQILIADNDARMASSLKFLLAPEVDRIFVAGSTEEVDAFLSSQALDLVLIDLCLLGAHTWGSIQRVYHHDSDIPVLLMSAQGDSRTAIQAMNQGASGYLKKPFEPNELIHKISSALGRQRLSRGWGVDANPSRDSDQTYRFLVENSPDIIYTLDRHGCFTFANRTLDRLLGWSPEALIGKSYRSILHHGDHPKAQRVFNERRTDPRDEQPAELRLAIHGESEDPVSSKEKHLTVDLKAVGVYDRPTGHGDKQFLGTFGVARDVSGRKSMEDHRHQTRRMEAIKTLVGGIAHDFNNLLMGIQGNTSLLLNHRDTQSAYQITKLKRIEELVREGGDLTEQLVGFAHGGRHQVQSINLNDIIHQVVNPFVRRYTKIQVRLDLAPATIIIRADAGQIEQVLFNLLANARQAMPQGGSVRITTRPWKLDEGDSRTPECPAGDYARIQVVDTGVGMSAETLDRVFDPFFTTRTRKRGTGLGLAACYGIIKNHGGIIRAASVPGKGSVFTILLPVILSYETHTTDSPDNHR